MTPPPAGLAPVVAAFVGEAEEIGAIERLGAGNINDTYRVLFRARPALVLQRLNNEVFPDPGCVADNVALVTAHLGARTGPGGGLRFPRLIETVDGANFHRHLDGGVWRCLTLVEGTASPSASARSDPACEAGRVLGAFHALLEDLDLLLLCDPLPGFHDLDRYRRAYLALIGSHRRRRGAEFSYCRKMIEARLEEFDLNELARRQGVRKRVVHGDPKRDNFLFDSATGSGVALIDLDTVAAGLTAADLGDCLRSFCNPAGETAGAGVRFDAATCARLLEGYRRGGPMAEADRDLVYHGVRLLTYELGLRFFSDYLDGDRYFKVADAEQNLRRACGQFRLLESIEGQRAAIDGAAWGR